MNELFQQIYALILEADPDKKCVGVGKLFESLNLFDQNDQQQSAVKSISQPGFPARLALVPPRELKRRGIQSQNGRNVLMHAIAHIEFNAINLALDAAYRFRNQTFAFYRDWIGIAADEARHFSLIRDYLNKHDCEYGDFQAHNGLWEMAVQTQHDIVARMALVPRVLEARGLDVTPAMIKRLERVNDDAAVAILQVIYEDEIGHVKTGSQWFFYHCEKRQLEPRETFLRMVDTHLHGELRGPFNISARLQAGFDEMELAELTSR